MQVLRWLCVFICPLAYSKNVAVAWPFSDVIGICYVFPVLWTTPFCPSSVRQRRRKQGVCSKWLNMGQLRTGGEVWCLRIPCVWLTTNFSYSVTVSLTNMVFRWTLQEHVEKAIALNPKDPTNYYLLGRWCYGVCTLRACVAHRFQSNHVMQFFTHVHFAIMLICCNKLLNV